MKNFEEHLKLIEKDISAKAWAQRFKIPGLYDVQDVEQELRMHLLKKFPNFDPKKAGFRTWAKWEMKSRIGDLRKREKKEMIESKDGFDVRRITNASQFEVKPQDAEDVGKGEVFEAVIASDNWEFVNNLISDVELKLALDKEDVNDQGRLFLKLQQEGYSFREIGDGIDLKTGEKIRDGKKFGKDKVQKIISEVHTKIKKYLK